MNLEEQQPQPMLRYDGEDRRLSQGEYPGAERRRLDPPTEQDHVELLEAN